MEIVILSMIKLKFPEDDSVSEKSLLAFGKNEPFYISADFDAPLEEHFSEYMS